jgi:hypothetical protein
VKGKEDAGCLILRDQAVAQLLEWAPALSLDITRLSPRRCHLRGRLLRANWRLQKPEPCLASGNSYVCGMVAGAQLVPPAGQQRATASHGPPSERPDYGIVVPGEVAYPPAGGACSLERMGAVMVAADIMDLSGRVSSIPVAMQP